MPLARRASSLTHLKNFYPLNMSDVEILIASTLPIPTVRRRAPCSLPELAVKSVLIPPRDFPERLGNECCAFH